MTDISGTLAPKSDQQNYDDYITGPRTVTVSDVKVPGGDQPVVVELVEYPGRPFKPNKSMRRILAKAWGTDSSVWVGRGLTLFGNKDVIYGGKTVGGIEIAAMSHLDAPLKVPLTVRRGQKKDFVVQPLAARPAAPTQPAQPSARDFLAEATAATSVDDIKTIWMDAQAAGAPQDLLASIFALAPKEQS